MDTHRAVTDARYSRDVLLVCDAMEGTDLPQLAAQFRVAEELYQSTRRALAPRNSQRIAAAAPPPREPVTPTARRMSFAR